MGVVRCSMYRSASDRTMCNATITCQLLLTPSPNVGTYPLDDTSRVCIFCQSDTHGFK